MTMRWVRKSDASVSLTIRFLLLRKSAQVTPDRFRREKSDLHAGPVAMLAHLGVKFLVDGNDSILAFLCGVGLLVH